MEASEAQPLGEGIVLEASVPMQWRLLESPPDAFVTSQLNSHNDRVLRVITALEENPPEFLEENGASGQDLAKLEFKVSLLLDLVGQLMDKQLQLPPAHYLRLGGQGVQWHCEKTPDTDVRGRYVMLEVFLHSGYPKPLRLCGELISIEAQEQGSLLTLHLCGVSETVQDNLERLIFRHHRRAIAQNRPAKS